MDGKRHIITIAAIGPDSGQTLTLGVYDALRQADALLLRTGRHGVADRLRQEGVAFETLDALYDRTEDFDELCELAARAIIDRARQAQTLIYAVSEPQSDATVRALVQALPGDMALRVLGGLTTRRRSIFWKTPPNRARRPGRSSFANWTGRTTTTTEPPCLCRESAYTTEAAHPMRTLCRSSAVCARPAGARGTGRRPITH